MPQPGNPPMLSDADVERMKDMPQTYFGYPLFTRWLASSEDCMVLRRFDQLHARVLLRKQDKIVRCEERINQIDKMHMNLFDQSNPSNNGSFREDFMQRGKGGKEEELAMRDMILERLEQELKDYGKWPIISPGFRASTFGPPPNNTNCCSRRDDFELPETTL